MSLHYCKARTLRHSFASSSAVILCQRALIQRLQLRLIIYELLLRLPVAVRDRPGLQTVRPNLFAILREYTSPTPDSRLLLTLLLL